MVLLLAHLEELSKLVQQSKLRIILASRSPRREQLLRDNVFANKVPFEVKPSGFKEDYDKSLYVGKAAEYVTEYAVQKALDVQKTVGSDLGAVESLVIIGCDTVVVNDGKILEKPENEGHAKEMLLSYGGKTQAVVSGVSLVLLRKQSGGTVTKKADSFHCETQVVFDDLDEETVGAYVATGEAYGKAGSYGIQGLGSTMIRGINGCYFNVVGLPVNLLSRRLGMLLHSEILGQRNEQ